MVRVRRGMKRNGRLTYEERRKLPDSDFAVIREVRGQKLRKYPIENENHARNALARVSANGTPAEKKAVCEAVAKRYPQIHAQSCPMHK